ncbi:MAG TPA: class I SAM-dependent methyltransferase [Chloroflexia bacterium]
MGPSGTPSPTTAAEQWATALGTWAIPPAILAAAPESPWGYAPALFARRAEAALAQHTPSADIAQAALPAGGAVLDVGCGAGAASLPLAGPAALLVGVDPSPELLAIFEERARALGVRVLALRGQWPAIAAETPVADVVVCHHVAYNVADLAPFVVALTRHARRRVVLELTARHPLSDLNDLWLRFHGLVRPQEPGADDAVAVLRELGLAPERRDWTAAGSGVGDGFATPDDLVAWTRRRLCLPVLRDPEIAATLAEQLGPDPATWQLPPRRLVTLWWPGGAGSAAAP